MNNKTSPCHAVSKGDCWTVTWQDPRRCCRGVGMPASCRSTAAPCQGTPCYLAPHPAKLGASLLSPAGTAPLHQGQIISGGQEGMGTCPGLAPVAASMTSRSPPWDTEAPKWGAGLSWAPLCWGQEMNLQHACSGWWSWKEPAWFRLHKCLSCAPVAQIQTKCLLSNQVSNPFSFYGQFPFHTSQSHISPDFCWDFASHCSQDLPGAAHGNNLLGSSTLCPLPGELLATLPTCVLLPFISSLPILLLPYSGNCSLSIFSL